MLHRHRRSRSSTSDGKAAIVRIIVPGITPSGITTMATPKASFQAVRRGGTVKARRSRAVPGLSGLQSRNCDLAYGTIADQQTSTSIAALLRKGSTAGSTDFGAIQQAGNSLNTLGAALLGGLQVKLLKNATALLGDAVAGRAAAPSMRLTVRRALRATAMAACTASYVVKVCTLAGSLAHAVDFSHGGLATEAELANAVCTLLGPTVGTASPPLLRAVGPVSALAADGLDLNAAVLELAQHLTENHNHPAELAAAGVEKVHDVVLTCIGAVESCQELMKIAAAPVGARADKRDGSDGCGGNSGEEDEH
ncbi:hypothetical protein PLESTM_000286400 [Pleodorina starrii]|nr:hypothetical protein PLESTM_000286400 [Pleodorina starrii]